MQDTLIIKECVTGDKTHVPKNIIGIFFDMQLHNDPIASLYDDGLDGIIDDVAGYVIVIDNMV